MSSSNKLLSGLLTPCTESNQLAKVAKPSLLHSHTCTPGPMELAESIKALHELHQQGGLTTEEFAQAKQQILETSSTSEVDRESYLKTEEALGHQCDDEAEIGVPTSPLYVAGDSAAERSWDGKTHDHKEEMPLLAGSPPRVGTAVLFPQKGKKVLQRDGIESGKEAIKEGRHKYGGTFIHPRHDVSADASGTIHFEPPYVVNVRYFNSRGVSGTRFSDVELKAEDMRKPVFLHKGAAAGQPPQPLKQSSNKGSLPHGIDGVLSSDQAYSAEIDLEFPKKPEAVLTGASAPEAHLWEGVSRQSLSQQGSSYLEQSLNWYWIDVTGRDFGRRSYTETLRYLTRKFGICESFLVNRDHILVLPQVCESPTHPGQYLLNLRVASSKISIVDDSVMELTNRWIIIVDLQQHFVITLHRIDTESMSQLRRQWKHVMETSDVSFQEFLLKIIDDAIQTYHFSLDVHADLLDKCEAKLFISEHAAKLKVSNKSEHMINRRIRYHFSGSSFSPFLSQLLDAKNHSPLNKSEMNNFLHHLHRRTSVQYRMLNVTETTLAKAFTKLELCSKEMARQMCGSCIELSGRALEVRDDAKTLLNLHISLQSFRTNELMAVLTWVSLLFTPCTFLAGVYGMNFVNLPEIKWKYGYIYFWCVCLFIVLLMHWSVYRQGMRV